MATFNVWKSETTALTSGFFFTPSLTYYGIDQTAYFAYGTTSNYNNGTAPWTVALSLGTTDFFGDTISAPHVVQTYTVPASDTTNPNAPIIFPFHYEALLLSASTAGLFWTTSANGTYAPLDQTVLNFQTFDPTGATSGTTIRLRLDGTATTVAKMYDVSVSGNADFGNSFLVAYSTYDPGTHTAVLKYEHFDTTGNPLNGGILTTINGVTGRGVALGTYDAYNSAFSTPDYVLVYRLPVGETAGVHVMMLNTSGGTLGQFDILNRGPNGEAATTISNYNFAGRSATDAQQQYGIFAQTFLYKDSASTTRHAVEIETVFGTSSPVIHATTDIIANPLVTTTVGIARIGNGDFVVAYDDGGQTYLREYDQDLNQIGTTFALPDDNYGFTNIVSLGDGRIEVVWRQSLGSTYAQHSAIYDTRQSGVILTPNSAARQVAGTQFNDTVNQVAGTQTIRGAGGSDTFAVAAYGLGNVALAVDAAGQITLVTPNSTDNLEQFTTVQLADATLTVPDGATTPATVASGTPAGLSIAHAGTVLSLTGNVTSARAMSLVDAVTVALAGHTLTLMGTAAASTGGSGGPRVTGAGTLALAGGTTLSALTIGAGAVVQNTGAITATGTVQVGDSSSAQSQIANAAGGTYSLAGDVGIAIGASTASTFNNNGGTLQKTSGTGISAIAASFQDSGGAAAQIKVTSGTLNFTGASNSFVNQAISGAGTFSIGGGGTSTISGGTTITTAGWTIGKVGTTVTLGQNLTYAGTFSDTNQTTLNLGANTLTLSGPATFNLGPGGSPIIAGTGKLVTSGIDTLGAFTLGGSVLFRSNGTVNQVGTITLGDSSNGAAQFTNAPGKTWSINGDFSIVAGNAAAIFNNGGATLTKASGTGTSAIGTNFINAAGTAAAITVSSGTLNFIGANNTFVADAISGAGTFAIGGGGTSTIGAGTTIATSAWTIAKVGTTVNLGENLTFAGSFSQTNQTLLDLGANTLTLSGAALFNLGPAGSPIIAGSGKLITNGTDSLGAFTLGGSVLLRNNGGVTQTGNITLGDSSNGAAQVTNAAGKSWVLTGDVGIVKGSTNALFNTGGGGFSKTGGTGVSTIGVNVTNLNSATSQIEVASGTLDFAGTVMGAQAFKIDAGRTLQFDASVATGSAVTFAGAGGTLLLNDAQDFKGSIAGFGAGQKLDLASIGFSSANVAYSGSTLTVAGGGKTASLAIGTGYNPASFHLANDTHGGSLVTYG